jgi:hypothetical protein
MPSVSDAGPYWLLHTPLSDKVGLSLNAANKNASPLIKVGKLVWGHLHAA